MILKMYVVHDDSVKQYGQLATALTHGQAEREFRTAVNNPQAGHLYNYPEQFGLYYTGDVDTDTGVVTPLPGPQLVIAAKQLKLTDEEKQRKLPGT